MKQRKPEKSMSILIILIAISFIISGGNGIIRTFCVSQPNIGHIIHSCIVLTTPLSYLGSIIILVIGVLILLLDRISLWWYKNMIK